MLTSGGCTVCIRPEMKQITLVIEGHDHARALPSYGFGGILVITPGLMQNSQTCG